jgi:hypothetical protein
MEESHMLMRIACVRCRLASLWTDEPRSFLATVCRDARHCEAILVDEEFAAAARPIEVMKERLQGEDRSC